ncbi:hypothetical protein D9758_009732 [Tetrapyrgos nigripes]|uniref:Uncharacterized protein n=1 Tax=Tetrapyrgos nigripes TaxID=182062 RepID=A0A8H5GJY5_9AGAR|nr:hypothetical protein D9758_009732 [Tetrapyrgos nigripes]
MGDKAEDLYSKDYEFTTSGSHRIILNVCRSVQSETWRPFYWPTNASPNPNPKRITHPVKKRGWRKQLAVFLYPDLEMERLQRDEEPPHKTCKSVTADFNNIEHTNSSVQVPEHSVANSSPPCQLALPKDASTRVNDNKQMHIDLNATNAEMLQVQIYGEVKGKTGDSQSLQNLNISHAGHITQNNAPLTVQPHSTASAPQEPIHKMTVIAPPAPPRPTNQAVYPVDLTDPARLTAFVPLEPQPAPECRHNNDLNVLFTRVDLLEGGFWNGFPNGRFAIDLDHSTFTAHKNLAVQWATRGTTGANGKNGQSFTVNGETISHGRESYKQCLGILQCKNEHCKIITRPKIQAKILEKQINTAQCQCGASLTYFPCESRSYLIEYGQVGEDISTCKYRYINGEPHNHPRLPYVKHLTAKEAEDTREHVGNNLDKTPLEAYEGGKNLDGPTPPAPQLAQALNNIDTY